MSDRNDLPQPSAPNFNQRMRETVQTYLGRQGDPLDRGLTLRDLLESGIVKFKDGFSAVANGRGSGALPLAPVVVEDKQDLTPPPQPDGFAVTAAISHVFIEHNAPIYMQGHGHLRTHVFGKTMQAGNPLPTFADAVEVGQFPGRVWAMPSNPATTWRLWIKWETVDGVLSPTPAGGTNGLEAVTGQDVALLLDALTGQITGSQLYQELGDRINLIDDPQTGLVKKTDDLVAVYGSTTSAAASAANAAQSATDAAQAEAYAILAKNGAANSATTASTKATESATSATNAAGSASSAATSATTAAQSANTATDKATAAATSASNAASSSTSAANSSTAATTAKVAAESAKDAALGSANAAATSANTASTKATEANQSASSASTSSTTASTKASDAGVYASNSATSASNAAGSASSAATALQQVQASNATALAAVQTEATARADETGRLFAKYGVKLDVNGYVTGWSMNNDGSTGSMVFRLDTFAIGSPGQTSIIPFTVQTTPTTINGVAVPAGVYMEGAYIKNGTITNAKIANLAVDNAKIASLAVDKLTAGDISAGQYIQSSNYVAGTSGFRLDANGTAYLQDAVLRGTVYAADGAIGSVAINANGLQSINYSAGVSGFQIHKNGTLNINSGTFSGALNVKSATSGARMEIANDVIRVYDESGILRVKIGNLAA